MKFCAPALILAAALTASAQTPRDYDAEMHAKILEA